MSPALNWFITGASSGFGFLLAKYALQQGHKVVGTARNRTKSAAQIAELEQAGATCITLDVTDLSSIPTAVRAAEETLGHIDVLVNNAGYGLIGPVEDISDVEAHKQMETNFFGPLALIRAVLPSMRERKSGTIVNVSSTAGINSMASCGLYSASKFGLEGLSEGLAVETAPLGIRTIIIEPGAFRTSFLDSGALTTTAAPLTGAYKDGPAEQVMNYLKGADGKQPGDPQKGVARMFEVVTGTGMAAGMAGKGADGKVLRVILGSDAVKRLNGKLDDVRETLESARDLAMSCDL